jgi:D-serine deaminase-like pyridoxal phosphate-dependent protein
MDDSGAAGLRALGDQVESILGDLGAAGLESEIVSGGSTPTLWHSHCVRGMNEIRPGTYIFNDRNTVASAACALTDCAASILATVVSTSVRNQFIIDGGSKTFSSDRLVGHDSAGYGHVVDAPEARFAKMNEEHGFVELENAAERFQVGDRVRVIPNHICVAMNLHETVYGVRGEQVEEIWRVEARGKLQ